MLNQKEVDRKWFLIDAQNQVLGRMATKIATILQGKNKPCYVPHLDLGDNVIVINAKDIILTGNKLEDKSYYKHSGYIGGLKVKHAYELYETNPSQLIVEAVKGMLPKNKLRTGYMKKLKVYNTNEHGHEAQKPESLSL